MPYKSDKLSINNSKLDKRVKIQPSQYDDIKELYIDIHGNSIFSH